MKDLSLHILDIVQNSIKAEAKNINIELRVKHEILYLVIADDGKGIDSKIFETIFDPFTTSRTKRKIGLGLPLLKSNVEFAGGSVEIETEINRGSTIKALIPINNIDRKPLGDIADTLRLLIMANESIDFILLMENNDDSVKLDTKEVKEKITGIKISNNDVLDWIEAYINEGIIKIFGGTLNEITC